MSKNNQKRSSFSLSGLLEKHFTIIWFSLVLFIYIISSLLILPKFGSLPDGLNRDETALGYNAYSLLKTGKDEWGTSWPISITSFGDQKLPGYVYTLIPFISIFDLEMSTVRLPSLLAGYVTIFMIGIIAVQLGNRLNFTQDKKLLFSGIAMLCLAVSPWHMHFSRVAYESHLALALFCGGLALYNTALVKENVRIQRYLIILAALCWSVTLLTYHSYHIFLPLFLLALVLIDRKSLPQLDKKGIGIGVTLGIISILLLFKGGVFTANEVKSRGTFALHRETLLLQATKYRGVTSGENTLYERILFNPITEGITILSQNIVSQTSGEFFFIRGSNHGDHNPGNGNSVHVIIFPLLVIALITLLQYKHHAVTQRIIAWGLVAFIPAALTIQPRHEVRLATLFPVIELLGAFGAITIIYFFSKQWQRIIITSLLLITILYSGFRTYIFYLYFAPETSATHQKHHILGQTIERFNTPENTLLVDSPSSSPYIWYIFENKLDPTFVQKNTIAYEPTDEGFIHVKRVGNITFVQPTVEVLRQFADEPNVLLLIEPGKLPDNVGSEFSFSLTETISDPSGKAIYEIWAVN